MNGGPNEEDPWTILRALPRGQEVELETADGTRWRGTLVPPHELSGDGIVQLKLASGYNVGIHVSPGDRLTVFPPSPHLPNGKDSKSAATRAEPPEPGYVSLLTTGGTIASKVDYRTGGVRPVKEEREILAFYPTLEEGGPVRIRTVLDRLSEEIGPGDWVALAEAVAEEFRTGARGVVVAHGTDTLAYTASALAFTLGSLPGPVVLVGAQRSPDRPSSDGSSNLQAAVELARVGNTGEVSVLMHAGLSDDRFSIHRATWVRKMHSSRRDAFRSRNGEPLGYVDATGVHLEPGARPPAKGPPTVDTRLDLRAGLFWFHPGADPHRAELAAEGLRGIIIAGTGLGHLASGHLPWIRRAVERGSFVGMTTQCLEGDTDPYVYATGRELLRAGVTYLGDLLPEVAYVKLLFALGRADKLEEVRAQLLTDWAGEFPGRHRVRELS
ncbi:MAG: Glu-tRNA(Gln) amidotransferase subunit GatD [Thermoplasmata archaeon]|nr:Glu-tRNA(Gln) amidotransferase subunit GatD [Thermoplasmata archaeon]